VNPIRKPITRVGLSPVYKEVNNTTICFSTHYQVQVLNSSPMSYGIAVNTRLAGGNRGTFLDDLTNRMSFQTSRLVLLL